MSKIEAFDALQNELSVMHAAIESYATPAEALKALIAWHVVVATDPRVNGGYTLAPVESNHEMKCEGEHVGEVTYEMAGIIYRAMLTASKETKECSGCGWSGTQAEYSDMRSRFRDCCPDSNLIAASKESGKCTYPECGCPIDKDVLCLKGLPNA